MYNMNDIGELRTKILNDPSRYKLILNYLEAMYDQAKENMVENNDKFQDLTLKGEARAYKRLMELLRVD